MKQDSNKTAVFLIISDKGFLSNKILPMLYETHKWHGPVFGGSKLPIL